MKKKSELGERKANPKPLFTRNVLGHCNGAGILPVLDIHNSVLAFSFDGLAQSIFILILLMVFECSVFTAHVHRVDLPRAAWWINADPFF